LNTIRAGTSLLQPIYSSNTYYTLRHIRKFITLFTGVHNLNKHIENCLPFSLVFITLSELQWFYILYAIFTKNNTGFTNTHMVSLHYNTALTLMFVHSLEWLHSLRVLSLHILTIPRVAEVFSLKKRFPVSGFCCHHFTAKTYLRK
jgi:hypothetical protein